MTKHKVFKLFDGKSDFYATKKVIEYIESFTVEENSGPVNEVINTIGRTARVSGFNPRSSQTVRDEGNGVLRIGEELKRIIGFNATVKKRFDFIAVDCVTKAGQRRSKDQSKKYKAAERIKKNGNWTVVKREEDL